MKITLKGTIEKINEGKQAGKNKVFEARLKKSYYDSTTGELKTEDFFPVQIWEDDMPAFKQAFEKSSVMEVEGFLNGRLLNHDNKELVFMNFTGKKFTAIEKKP